jgi:hypothetical protein
MTTPGHLIAQPLRRSLLALAAAALGTSAQAQLPPPTPAPPPVTNAGTEPQTWSIGLSQTLTHESNLFRVSDDDTSVSEREDWVSTTALNFGLDQPLGRQRLRGQAALLQNRYREHDELNDTGHDLRLLLDWETVGNLNGDIGAQSTKRQYRYGLDSVGPSDGPNEETTQAAFFHARLGGMGLWALQFGAETLRRDYSAASFAIQELSQHSVEGGIGYRPSPDLSGALLLRHTRIDRNDVTAVDPPGTTVGDDVDRNDVELNAAWQASGASRFEARLTRSQEEHKVIEDRSFWAGSLGWLWAPSAKLNFTTRLVRDTEGQSGDLVSAESQLPAVSASDQLRNALEWTASWEATSKVQLLGSAQWSRRTLTVEGRELNDRTLALGVGLRYNAARWLEMGCDVRHEQRETNASEPAERLVTRPYDALAAGCMLAVWFR